MKSSDIIKLALAVLLGAALAFPAGMLVAGSRTVPDRAVSAERPNSRAVRDVFSPSIRDDPWFLDRQRESVEALERHCAQTGQTCREARAARQRLTELETGG